MSEEEKDNGGIYDAIGKLTVSFLIGLPLAVLVTAPMLVWKAFIARCLWGWFITPFFEIRVPSMLEMIGIMILFTFMIPKSHYTMEYLEKKKTINDKFKGYVYPTILPAIVLLAGYIVHLLQQ